MQTKCPYCEFQGASRGIKRHVALAHPAMVAEHGLNHVTPVGRKKGIRRELLVGENPRDDAKLARLNRSKHYPHRSQLVLVRSEKSPRVISMTESGNNPSAPTAAAAPSEKKYECENCGLEMDEVSWETGNPECPRCRAPFDAEELE